MEDPTKNAEEYKQSKLQGTEAIAILDV